MKYILDTNVVSELIATKPETAVLAHIERLNPEAVFLSAITIGEIKRGIERLPESPKLSRLRSWFEEDMLVRFKGQILAIDCEVMLSWGVMVARLSNSGITLPAMDSLIAAQAIHHKCTLVTRNYKDFQNTGVVTINPWS